MTATKPIRARLDAIADRGKRYVDEAYEHAHTNHHRLWLKIGPSNADNTVTVYRRRK